MVLPSATAPASLLEPDLTVEGNQRVAAILAADIQPLLDRRRKT